MAQYTVTHSCDHEEVHRLFGKHTERERKIAWFETTLCTECWRKSQDEARAKQNEQAKEVNATAGLPALTGSEKQIGWAETIRATTRKYLLAGEALIRTKLDLPEPARTEVSDAIVLIVDEVLVHDQAKWWIDNRRLRYVVAENNHVELKNTRGYGINENSNRTASWLATEIVARGLAPSYNSILDAEKEASRNGQS